MEQPPSLPIPVPDPSTEPELKSRADPTFKRITEYRAQSVGVRVIGADLPQIITADLVLEIPVQVRLEDTLFNFLVGFDYAVLDFKGQSDNLDMPKFQLNVGRTALFCSRHPQTPSSRVLNLIVSSRYPADFLKEAGETLTNSAERPWLWRNQSFYQQVAIVVCRDLPLEPRYYEWLIFAPAGGNVWKEFVRLLIREEQSDLLDVVKKMRPKEFEAMRLDILSGYDPQEKKRLEEEYLQLLESDLVFMAEADPQRFERLFVKMQLLKQQLDKLESLKEVTTSAPPAEIPLVEPDEPGNNN